MSKSTPVDMGKTSVMKYKKARPIEVIEIEALKVDDILADVQSKYHIGIIFIASVRLDGNIRAPNVESLHLDVGILSMWTFEGIWG